MRDRLAWTVVGGRCSARRAVAGRRPRPQAPSRGGDSCDERGAPRPRPRRRLPVVREVTIPDGTTLRLDLVDAARLRHEQGRGRGERRRSARRCAVDGKTVLPAGAELAGVVTDVEDSGRVKGRARIAYRFKSMRGGDERYEIADGADLARGRGDEEGGRQEDRHRCRRRRRGRARLPAAASGAAKGAAIGGARRHRRGAGHQGQGSAARRRRQRHDAADRAADGSDRVERGPRRQRAAPVRRVASIARRIGGDRGVRAAVVDPSGAGSVRRDHRARCVAASAASSASCTASFHFASSRRPASDDRDGSGTREPPARAPRGATCPSAAGSPRAPARAWPPASVRARRDRGSSRPAAGGSSSTTPAAVASGSAGEHARERRAESRCRRSRRARCSPAPVEQRVQFQRARGPASNGPSPRSLQPRPARS